MPTILSPSKIAQRIPNAAKDLFETVKGLEKTDILIMLLSLEDGYYNFISRTIKNLNRTGEDVSMEENEALALYRHIQQNMIIIENAIFMVLHLAEPGPRHLSKFPAVEPGMTVDPEIYQVIRQREGHDSRDEVTFYSPMRMMGKYDVFAAISLVESPPEDVVEALRKLLNLMSKIRGLVLLQQALRLGYSVTEIEGIDIPRINYPSDVDIELTLKLERGTTRDILGSSWTSVGWNPEVLAATQANFEQSYQGVDSYANRVLLAEEFKALSDGYAKFPGYEKIFTEEMGSTLDEFLRVTQALMGISRNATPHQIYYGLPKRFKRELKHRSGMSERKVSGALESLLWQKGLPPIDFPIYDVGTHYLFSMIRVMAAFNFRLEAIMREHYRDTNQKGRLFEFNCRDVMKQAGVIVYPDRLMINRQVLPTELSKRLWNKVKTATDFDIIGRRNRILLVAECKEIKFPSRRLVKVINEFRKFEEELHYKAKWVTENLELVRSEMGSKSKEVFEQPGPTYLLPLLVSTYPIETGQRFGIPMVTFSEFQTLCQQLDSFEVTGKEGVFCLSIPNVILGRTIQANLIALPTDYVPE